MAPGLSPRIVLATRPVHFQKGIDGLAGVVENKLGLDPYSGVAVVFRCQEQRDQIKVLWWDGSSLVLMHKRLEHGRFFWPSVHHGRMHLSRVQFEVLFKGLDWRAMLTAPVLTGTGWAEGRGL